MKKWCLLIILPIIIVACYYDNEETLYPETDVCDTIEISYSSDIVPILSTNCYTCHSNINAPDFGSNISLEDYADVSNRSFDILGAISHEDPYTPMPKDRIKLDDCLINKFEAWVNQGSPDN